MLYFSDVVYYQEKLMEYSFLSMIYVFSIVHDQEINCDHSSFILENDKGSSINYIRTLLNKISKFYTIKV